MSRVATLRHLAMLDREVVRMNLEGVTHAHSVVQPRPAGNCINFVLGHLCAVYERALPMLGQDSVRPAGALSRYDRGSPPLTDPSEALPLAELEAIWREQCARVDAGLGAMTDEQLAEPSPPVPGVPGDSLGDVVTTMLFHQAYHAGQLGVLRRLAGIEGAIR